MKDRQNLLLYCKDQLRFVLFLWPRMKIQQSKLTAQTTAKEPEMIKYL